MEFMLRMRTHWPRIKVNNQTFTLLPSLSSVAYLGMVGRLRPLQDTFPA